MNKVILMGRLTRNPVVRYSQGAEQMAIARYTLAVDRRRGKENTADFISCVAFEKAAEHAEKYYKQGTKILITGRIQTGSYDKDGQRVYTTDVVIEDQEFAESKKSSSEQTASEQTAREPAPTTDDGFMNIPDGIDEELPLN